MSVVPTNTGNPPDELCRDKRHVAAPWPLGVGLMNKKRVIHKLGGNPCLN